MIMASEDDILGAELINAEELLAEAEQASAQSANSPATVRQTEQRDDEEEDENVDETFAERVWGLTEMFPSWLRKGVSGLTSGSIASAKFFYGFSRSAMWIFFSSSAILMAPVIFEVERAQMDEMQKQQQRQILLGPNAAMVGGNQPHFSMPVPPPPQSR